MYHMKCFSVWGNTPWEIPSVFVNLIKPCMDVHNRFFNTQYKCFHTTATKLVFFGLKEWFTVICKII